MSTQPLRPQFDREPVREHDDLAKALFVMQRHNMLTEDFFSEDARRVRVASPTMMVGTDGYGVIRCYSRLCVVACRPRWPGLATLADLTDLRLYVRDLGLREVGFYSHEDTFTRDGVFVMIVEATDNITVHPKVRRKLEAWLTSPRARGGVKALHTRRAAKVVQLRTPIGDA